MAFLSDANEMERIVEEVLAREAPGSRLVALTRVAADWDIWILTDRDENLHLGAPMLAVNTAENFREWLTIRIRGRRNPSTA